MQPTRACRSSPNGVGSVTNETPELAGVRNRMRSLRSAPEKLVPAAVLERRWLATCSVARGRLRCGASAARGP